MTKLLEEAIEKLKALPDDRQDELARLLIELAEDEPYQLTPEQEAEVEIARGQVARGEFASDEQIAAMWRRFGG